MAPHQKGGLMPPLDPQSIFLLVVLSVMVLFIFIMEWGRSVLAWFRRQDVFVLLPLAIILSVIGALVWAMAREGGVK
jgi:hypothetical protein